MSSLPCLARALHRCLEVVPNAVGRECGFVMRLRKMTPAVFVQALVSCWSAFPDATWQQLAVACARRGVAISHQGLAKRFTPAAAAVLQRVVEAIGREVVASAPPAIPLLQRFTQVCVLDSTIIRLPTPLADHWPGFGGWSAKHAHAACKVTIMWDLVSGRLYGPELTAARVQDRATALQQQSLPPGSLRIADRGFLALGRLQQLATEGSWLISYLAAQTVLRDPDDGCRLEVTAWLRGLDRTLGERPVLLGATGAFAGRLIALPISQAQADRRRSHLRQDARKRGAIPNANRLAWADWDLLITNVPPDLLHATDAVVLLRARWQIELLFKYWKSIAHLTTWRSSDPDRIHCEVLAKLIGVALQHWLVVTGGWSTALPSLPRAFAIVRPIFWDLPERLDQICQVTAVLTRGLAALTTHAKRTRRKQRISTLELLLDPDLILASPP